MFLQSSKRQSRSSAVSGDCKASIGRTDASGYIEGLRDGDGGRDQGVGPELVSVALTFHNTAPDAVDTPICNDPDAISAVARNRVSKMRQGGSYSASSGLSTRFRTSLKVSKKDFKRTVEHELLGDCEKILVSCIMLPSYFIYGY